VHGLRPALVRQDATVGRGSGGPNQLLILCKICKTEFCRMGDVCDKCKKEVNFMCVSCNQPCKHRNNRGLCDDCI
jgi:hypothetical protein